MIKRWSNGDSTDSPRPRENTNLGGEFWGRVFAWLNDQPVDILRWYVL